MLRVGFPGDNTGSNPVGDAIKNQLDTQGFALHSWVQNGHDSVPFLHPQIPSLELTTRQSNGGDSSCSAIEL
jgi:hypothetical protein